MNWLKCVRGLQGGGWHLLYRAYRTNNMITIIVYNNHFGMCKCFSFGRYAVEEGEKAIPCNDSSVWIMNMALANIKWIHGTNITSEIIQMVVFFSLLSSCRMVLQCSYIDWILNRKHRILANTQVNNITSNNVTYFMLKTFYLNSSQN